MSQNFIIRKNKSLKELKGSHNHFKWPSGFPEQRNPAVKDNTPKNNQKILFLQPLMKTKDNYRQPKQVLEVRLDNTQPVNVKSASLAITRLKQQPDHVEHLQLHLFDRPNLLGKENRPASMNEIKYPSISKIKPHFCQGQKYESLKAFAQLAANKELKKVQIKHVQEQEKKQNYVQPLSKLRIIKQSSKSRLVKLHRQQKERELRLQPELQSQKSFRKCIIDKIQQNKKKQLILGLLDFQDKKEEVGTTKAEARMQGKAEARMQAKAQAQESCFSPKLKKDHLNWDNCSTIKEQEESGQSFLSKNPFQSFSETCQLQNLQVIFNENKAIFNRRPKMEVEKIKKKFPQNFFK